MPPVTGRKKLASGEGGGGVRAGEAKESGSKGLEVASILFRFRQNHF